MAKTNELFMIFVSWNGYAWKESLSVVDKLSSGYTTLYTSLYLRLGTYKYFALRCIWLEQTQCTTFIVHKLCWSAAMFPDILPSLAHSTIGACMYASVREVTGLC